jgi:cytochrome P450
VLRGMQDRVQQIVDELLSNAIADGRMEVVGDFAWHLPLIVVGEMLDLPASDRHKIRQWAIDIGTLSGGSAAKMTENVRAGHRSLFALRDHLLGVFAERRGKPTTDLMSALLNAETEGGDRFTQDELIFMTAQMVFAGHETTANLIGTGLGGLLSDRSQWEALCADPSLIAPSVEELLRFCSPAQAINRWVSEETEVRGVAIQPGDAVMLMLGAANRDPEHFENPEKLDVRRRDFKHVAFGLGPHYCLGASLNRLETTTALTTLVRRFPEMRLTEELKWAPNWQFMGLSRLPVDLGSDRG